MNKDENMKLKEVIKTFTDVLLSNNKNDFLKMNYDEVLDLEIELIRNTLVWEYDYKYFNIQTEEKELWKRASWDFERVLQYCEYDKNKTEEINLANKFFLCNLWKQETLYKDIAKDTFKSPPYYFKYMNIGIPNGIGNHALFKATTEHKDYEVDVFCIDESNFLKNLDFKNYEVYYKDKVFEYIDHRCLALMFLTKIKLENPDLDEFSKKFLKI